MSAEHVYLENEEDGFVVDQQTEANSEDEDEFFSCKYCELLTDTIDELDEHIVNVHGEEFIFEEDEQDIKYEGDVHEGEEEKKEEQTDSYPNAVKRIFVCPYCGYQSMKKHNMNKHLATHQVPADYVLYACSECSYSTKRKCDMPKHLLRHCDVGNVPVYKCPDCTYATRRKGDLTKHSLIHKKPPSSIFTCSQCPYSSRRQSELKKHLTIHDKADMIENKISILNCTECGYTTTKANVLHRHVVLHCDRDYKNIFKCKICDYASITGSHFAKHVLSYCLERENQVEATKQVDPLGPDQEFVMVDNEISSHVTNEEVHSRKRKLSSTNYRYKQRRTDDKDSAIILNDDIIII